MTLKSFYFVAFLAIFSAISLFPPFVFGMVVICTLVQVTIDLYTGFIIPFPIFFFGTWILIVVLATVIFHFLLLKGLVMKKYLSNNGGAA